VKSGMVGELIEFVVIAVLLLSIHRYIDEVKIENTKHNAKIFLLILASVLLIALTVWGWNI